LNPPDFTWKVLLRRQSDAKSDEVPKFC
jgi:hypothetical protein